MLAYSALVLGHIIYSAVFGVSSTAWDSTAELVALAMNSSPTQVLQNTCAGIIGRQALKTLVRVLVTAPGHLELVFGAVDGQNAPTSKLVMNEKYGKLKAKKTTKIRSRGSVRRVRYGKGMWLDARSKGRLRQRS
ncbi:hypothetical protein MMC22_000603, partial [Lobaria immixta]|nr:hypothetical protein [Lobaria immixta]